MFSHLTASGCRRSLRLNSVAAWKISLGGLPGRQVEDLVGAERHASGLGSLQLLPAEAGAHLAEALPAVARFGLPCVRRAPAGHPDAGATAPDWSGSPRGTGLAATSPRACTNGRTRHVDRRLRTAALETPAGSPSRSAGCSTTCRPARPTGALSGDERQHIRGPDASITSRNPPIGNATPAGPWPNGIREPGASAATESKHS